MLDQTLRLVVNNKAIIKFFPDETIQLETPNGVLDDVLVSYEITYFSGELTQSVEICSVKIGDLELDQYQLEKMVGKTHIDFLEQNKLEQLILERNDV